MSVFINSTFAISAQNTFSHEGYLNEILDHNTQYLRALEPDYKPFIEPRAARRMARIIKMCVATSSATLESAGITNPDAIIVGTGLGCLQDTEKFLSNVIDSDEGLLSPTSFIQSTHNTMAGQIALKLGCNAHNFTYVQRGHSFETALEDAILQIKEGKSDVLVGAADEITPSLFTILSEMNCVSSGETSYPDMDSQRMPSLGEGATFFAIGKDQNKNSLAQIDSLQLAYGKNVKPAKIIEGMLSRNDLSLKNIDAVMLGFNGDPEGDKLYNKMVKNLFSQHPILMFKNLCGEYFSASAFGQHLASMILKNQSVPEAVMVSGSVDRPLKNILFYNHHNLKYHTFTLISACQDFS